MTKRTKVSLSDLLDRPILTEQNSLPGGIVLSESPWVREVGVGLTLAADPRFFARYSETRQTKEEHKHGTKKTF
ncbi:MAG: hypothetical protein A3F11_05865 [Gammaproteobacteria bacterium RIFCSPHIGHO2_12_FULL_37_14]|nr:MAG: hypothetical protein A3F11_05865 [Gammaproteobacteria bacterium RIFCSPHIGHO2_12_FULL_37_14]